MTENLAGRGEGLAGLVAQRIRECRETAKRWKTESRIVRINRAIGKDYADQLDALASLLETALEAAAPPGTPDVFDFVGRKMATHLVETMGALEGFAEPFRAAGQSALEEFWFRATGKHIDWDSLAPEVRAGDLTAALATPSPQAPPTAIKPFCIGYPNCDGDLEGEEHSEQCRIFFSTTSAREQSSATASDSLNEAAQEILKPHWPSVRNMEENEARQKEVERIIRILRGSPRKVGEDGAHNELSLVRLVLSAHQTAYARFHNGEGRGVIEADQMAIGYASVELAKALARPSSVPVGEQK